MSEFSGTLLVIGSEELLVERCVQERVTAALAEHPGAEVIDLSSVDVADGRLAEAAGGSLFADASVVVAHDLSGLPDEQADLVLRIASHPDDDLCLVLTFPGGVKGKTLIDKLIRAKVPKVEVEPVKAKNLPGFVMTEAKRAKVRLDPAAATALIDAVGDDLQSLAAAVTQLADDCPGATLTVDLVNRYFSGRADVAGYSVANAVLAGRRQEALKLLRWAFTIGVSSVFVTTALASALRALGKYLGYRSQGLSQSDMERIVGVPYWKFKELSAQAREWTPKAVSQGIVLVAKADGEVKGASVDPQYALERLLLDLDKLRLGR